MGWRGVIRIWQSSRGFLDVLSGPWPPMQWTELFGDELLSGKTSVPTKEALKSAKYVGIYFSGSWCPPGRPPPVGSGTLAGLV